MLVSDILNSCVHGHVAEAAIASIGGDFAENVKRHAGEQGQSVGEFTAFQVRKFSMRASERDWRDVVANMRGEDLALLSGLQVVMLRMMSAQASDRSDRSAPVGREFSMAG